MHINCHILAGFTLTSDISRNYREITIFSCYIFYKIFRLMKYSEYNHIHIKPAKAQKHWRLGIDTYSMKRSAYINQLKKS